MHRYMMGRWAFAVAGAKTETPRNSTKLRGSKAGGTERRGVQDLAQERRLRISSSDSEAELGSTPAKPEAWERSPDNTIAVAGQGFGIGSCFAVVEHD